MHRAHYQFISGMTLVELMVAMLLSCLIFTSVTSIYLVLQKNFKTQASLNALHENSQTALHILTENIKAAGYMGCAKLSDNLYLKKFDSWSLSPENKIIGKDDAIIIQKINSMSATLVTGVNHGSVLYISDKPRFKKGDVAVISDCIHAEMFKIENISYLEKSQRIQTSKPILADYNKYAEVSLFQNESYFIAKTSRKNISGLYLKENNKPKIELVEGIEKMRFLYDVNLNNKIVSLPANQISDWSLVRGVSIMLIAADKVNVSYVALRN
ncbi:MAG: hypothetical protein P4M12_07380 [Gammaproteobacteria bacterium]|nr:hypothetical protein [Gammaproteobacteria bacterium]